MTMDDMQTTEHCHAVVGNESNFWLYDSRTGFDLTHRPTADSPPISPRITLQTTNIPITIDPAKTALVIVDMQNYFLSPAVGRQRGVGHDAVDQLVQHAIPAARKAGIRIIWLNWGLTEQDIEELSPAMRRSFGFEGRQGDRSVAVNRHGNVYYDEEASKPIQPGELRIFKGPGSSMGRLVDPESQEERHGGTLLMRDQWNTALFPPLDELFEKGRSLASAPDVWIHKNRMSGLWSPSTPLAQFLAQEGLRTLLFTGVNTDQCVGGTLTDCFNNGYDCVLLNDGCGTTSGAFAQRATEFNASNVLGFQTTCKAFAEGVSQAVLK